MTTSIQTQLQLTVQVLQHLDRQLTLAVRSQEILELDHTKKLLVAELMRLVPLLGVQAAEQQNEAS